MPRREADIQGKEEQQAGIGGSFVQLEEVIKKLEAGDNTLEGSFACYETGMKLVKSLNSQVDEVEKKIQTLNKGDENE